MKTANLTTGQQKFLLESLTNQKSPKTPAERSLLNELRDLLSEPVTVDKFIGTFKRCGNYVKQIHMDTFGDRWNNCWIKIKRTDKGEYITAHYFDNKRLYLS